MAWLHTAFGRHQPLNENGRNNCRKGYKVANDKNTDPDNSDTPLLHDNISNSDKVFNSELLGNVSLKSDTQNLTKTGFSATLFSKNKVEVNSKGPASSQSNTEEKVCPQTKALTEDKNLLNCKEKIPSLYGGFYEDDFDSADEELPLPISGGYRRLRDDLLD